MKPEKPSSPASIIYLALGAIPWGMSDSLGFFIVARVVQSIVSNTQVRWALQRLIKVVRRLLPLTLGGAIVALSVQVPVAAAELGRRSPQTVAIYNWTAAGEVCAIILKAS